MEAFKLHDAGQTITLTPQRKLASHISMFNAGNVTNRTEREMLSFSNATHQVHGPALSR
jgi:hypothetical protein